MTITRTRDDEGREWVLAAVDEIKRKGTCWRGYRWEDCFWRIERAVRESTHTLDVEALREWVIVQAREGNAPEAVRKKGVKAAMEGNRPWQSQ